MSIKERKSIKVGQLLVILNQRMMRDKSTAQCKITSITPMPNQAADQCNWSSTVTWNAHGQNRELAMPIVRRLVMNAQKEFNLLPFGAA
ncbi:MAG: hypothetical protein R3217_10705 [Gammaproteobacteria bacterium]|nr:hypothetical protein [Gammaproteobacteria bacterium]